MKHLILLFTSLLALLTGCATQPVLHCDYDLAGLSPSKLHKELLADVPKKNAYRELETVSMFEHSRCLGLELQDIPHTRFRNVMCTIFGESEEEIVIAAHYDRTGAGQGVADNWSGIVILRSLMDYYMENKPIHTLRFVAFAEEETGLRGSSYYVKEIQRGNLPEPRAMISVDTIGVGALTYDMRSDQALSCVLQQAARAHDLELARTRDRQMSGDWEPFKKAGIPVLSLHSLDSTSVAYVHTYRDRFELIDVEIYEHSYRVIAETLHAVDHGIDITARADVIE